MKNYFRDIAIQTIVWAFFFIFFTMLRQFGQRLVDEPEPRSILEYVFIFLIMGLVVSISFVSIGELLNKRIKSIKSFGLTILIQSFFYLIILVFVVSVGVVMYSLSGKEILDLKLILNYLFSKEGSLTLFYLFFVSILVNFVKNVDKKFGPGNLLRMLKGEFHSPKEVERIVMFLDLKSSTTIAEQIGHLNYSQFVQDCFDQLHMVKKYNAEIYQYVGDEVVLVWEPDKGLENANFINFFFSYRQSLIDKNEYFKSTYGCIPTFKCGCEMGKVVMTEVGQIKREIAYHGDVMNSAARIQNQCNSLNKEFLLSEKLYKRLSRPGVFKIDFIGSFNLKGKVTDVKIYSVEVNNN